MAKIFNQVGTKASEITKNVQDFDTKSFLFGGDPLYTVYYTKSDLGKVGGYSRYRSKHGYANYIGMPTQKMVGIEAPELSKVDIDYETFLDPYINGFQNSKVSLGNVENSDFFDDPTFIVFDIEIDDKSSPLFGGAALEYMNEYKENIPEMSERIRLYNYVQDNIFKIFPKRGDDKSLSNKQHYIQSISGLDLLFNKIINYPEDKILITLSEDINMLSMFLAESYNNMIFSYDTQRYMIPDNLLRFDMRIIFSDIRTMKNIDKKRKINPARRDQEIFWKSKFIYVLHDCIINFSNSRNFGNELTVSGWNSSVNNTPATLQMGISFKSYSKITVPANISRAKNIDMRLREKQGIRSYQEVMNYDAQKDLNKMVSANTDSGLLGKVKDKIKDEIKDLRSTLLNKLKEQTQGLADRAQKALGDSLGITVTKFNVYYDSPANALDKVSLFVGDFVDKKVDEMNSKIFGDPIRQPVQYREVNVYSDATYATQKIPTGDVMPDGKYNQKNPDGYEIDMMGKYNEKYPSGDVVSDGQYNEKYPTGKVHNDGSYNEKYPVGDVLPDGRYNQKIPDGKVQENGKYNEKYPNGYIMSEGQYNEKYPNGDVLPDGQYNEKTPTGKVNEKGKYNVKYPVGDVLPERQYNNKKPSGKLYQNQQLPLKYPNGQLFTQGQYNEKYPNGDVMPDGSYNDKKPSGKLYQPKQLEIEFIEENVYGNKKQTHIHQTPIGNRYKKK